MTKNRLLINQDKIEMIDIPVLPQRIKDIR